MVLIMLSYSEELLKILSYKFMINTCVYEMTLSAGIMPASVTYINPFLHNHIMISLIVIHNYSNK